MQNLKVKFDNEVQLKVISGKTGEVVTEWAGDNAISDDMIAGGQGGGRIFAAPADGVRPYCFLLPDGPNWTGFTYDRQNPWAPYCISVNNSVDTGAEPFWKQYSQFNFFAPDNMTNLLTQPPTGIAGRYRLFFSWGIPGLPFDFQLKAIGLTAWANNYADYIYGAGSQSNLHQSIFVPQTLVVLPAAITVHGRDNGLGTPDVLQISYFLSIVGVG